MNASNHRQNDTKYILIIILAICFLATGGIFVKLSKLPPVNTGFYRVVFSIPMLMPFAIKHVRELRKKDILLIFIAGMFLAGDLSLWNISFGLTTVANANLLANLTPFTVIPISYFIFKEKIPQRFFLGIVITIIGVLILMIGKINPSMNNFKGDILAFSTSIFYALFLVTVYRLRDKFGSTVIMFISAFGSSFVLFFVMLFTEGIYYPKNLEEIYPLIGLALVSQIMGQGLLTFCLGKVNATLSSVICLTQPVIAAIYSFIIFSEVLSMAEIMGIIIALVGIFVSKKTFINKGQGQLIKGNS